MRTIGEIGDKLRECINHAYRDEYEDMQKFGSNVKHLDEAMSLLNELVEGSKAGHWIPVSEGSPKESGKYLVTFGGTYLIGEDFYSTEEDAKEIFEEPEENIGWRSHNVIAWTQLPKPYKVENEVRKMTEEEVIKELDMTREEAIKELEEMQGNYCFNESELDALDMAIEALKQAREKQEPREDVISREQAKSDYADWYGYGYEDNTYYKHLCSMPSVTPLVQSKPIECKDVISRQAAIDAMIKIEQDDIEQYGCSILEGFNSDPAVEALEKLPSVTSQSKLGRWITHPNGIYAHLVCNRCLSRAPYDCHTNYCPNCGQQMVKEVKE